MKSIYLSILFFLNGCFVFGQNAIVNRFLHSEELKHAAVSFELKNLATGNIVAAYNENTSLTPASVNKIITTAAALETLGKNFVYQTFLFHDGIIRDSVLIGNLYVEGAGDPTLGSEYINKENGKEAFLNTWLADIKKQGIKKIEGDIIVLDQLFGYNGVSYKWLWEDLGNYYASGIYGISVFDNIYRIFIQSFSPGDTTKILYTIPPMADLHFKNEIVSGINKSDLSHISGIPFSNERRLCGSIPPNLASFPVRGDIPDPGLYLSTYLKAYLEKKGIQVLGDALSYRLNPVVPEEKNIISVVNSPNLASIVKVVNVRSNNHYAEHLYKLLTIKKNVNIPDFWKQKGLDSSALFMFDGSGISPSNAVSVSFLNSILTYMYQKEGVSGAFYQSLPLAGREGTVISFLKGSVLERKARFKSGSITNVQSYSGYIEYGGKNYVFSIIVNNFNGTRPVLKKQIEHLLVGLLQNP